MICRNSVNTEMSYLQGSSSKLNGLFLPYIYLYDTLASFNSNRNDHFTMGMCIVHVSLPRLFYNKFSIRLIG